MVVRLQVVACYGDGAEMDYETALSYRARRGLPEWSGFSSDRRRGRWYYDRARRWGRAARARLAPVAADCSSSRDADRLVARHGAQAQVVLLQPR